MKRSKYHSFEELPLMLNVQDVADVLGIGLAHAYEVVHRRIFPPSPWAAGSSFPETDLWRGSGNQAEKKFQ